MLLEQCDEVVHLLRIQVERCAAFSGFGKARRGARLLHVGHEVEKDEVHVLDLVGSVAHELVGRHSRWDVAADAQAALVGFVDDDGNEFRLDRAVDLDLHIAEIGVVVNPLASLFRRGGKDFDRALIGAGTVDESGEYQARANLLAAVDVLAQGGQIVDRVAKIANRGYSGSDVEERVVGEEMRVHVPQAGQQHLA